MRVDSDSDSCDRSTDFPPKHSLSCQRSHVGRALSLRWQIRISSLPQCHNFLAFEIKKSIQGVQAGFHLENFIGGGGGSSVIIMKSEVGVVSI